MSRLMGFVDRLLPPLLMAASVTLLTAGLLSYGAPLADGTSGTSGSAATGPGPGGGGPPGNPGDLGTPAPGGGSFAAPSTGPVSSASAGATATSTVTTSLPPGSSPGVPGSTPGPGTTPGPGPDASVATRVVVPSEGIDLPVVSRDLAVPGQGPDQYPPCDVAVYHTAFQQPGEQGTTYIYAHARAGMFLPLLQASLKNDGAALIGDLIQVYTDDDREYVYQISLVDRHATDYSLADNLPPGESQLILQTSEGPRGTVPKLQIQALPIDVLTASDAAAHPKAKPRACYNTP